MVQKQQQLLFDKGITNVPSDALCSDNALEESIGMVYDNGEHRVIQKPVEVSITGGIDGVLLYIHKIEDESLFIYLHKEQNSQTLKFKNKDNSRSGNIYTFAPTNTILSITSVGKTVIVSDSNGLHYFLLKLDSTWSYLDIGQIPMPKPDFRLEPFEANNEPETVEGGYLVTTYWSEDYYEYTEPKDVVKSSGSHKGIFRTNGFLNPPNDPDDEHPNDKWPDYHQEEYNNLVVGLYSKNKKNIAEKKCFCNPFFVRVALELYDGSYTNITNPVLMMAGVRNNSYARISTGWNFTIYTFLKQLMVMQKQDYTYWSDIVKDVVVFASDPVDVNETDGDISIYKKTGEFTCESLSAGTVNNISEFRTYTQVSTEAIITNPSNPQYTKTIADGDKLPYHYAPMKSKTEDDVIESLKSKSVFYKLCSIGITPLYDWITTREKIEQHVLENLTTQEQLPFDYYSGCPLKADYLYAYNCRLNMSQAYRGFFAGFNTFMPLDFTSATTWYFKVKIKTDTGNRYVWHSVASNQKMGYYFYYPDPRAEEVTIYKGKTDIFGSPQKLEEHPGLNGAFFIKKIYSDGQPWDSATYTAGPPDGYGEPSADYEYLPNTILVSEANNPYVFLMDGYNKVGTGDFLGMSSTTQALSDGQFGQYPLLAFTTDGIWALSVASTGYYSACHPMSREVCNNPKSITQTDGAVFFTSEKGLMVVVGGQVKCVSEQLSGKTRRNTMNGFLPADYTPCFNEFLKGCIIAYDYRDSLLWLFNSEYTGCFVYSIKSGTFGKYEYDTYTIVIEGETITATDIVFNVANNYPDYFLQGSSGKIRSLLNRKNINKDTNSYSAKMLTRPMKLENALALKSIMQVRNIKDFNSDASIGLHIYASNNFNNWVELTSLKGTPWKYYRFGYEFSNLKATDLFSGAIVVTQERRTDKLR